MPQVVFLGFGTPRIQSFLDQLSLQARVHSLLPATAPSDLLNSQGPDLLIVEDRPPDVDALAWLTDLHSSPARIPTPVLVFMHSDDPQRRCQLWEAGAADAMPPNVPDSEVWARLSGQLSVGTQRKRALEAWQERESRLLRRDTNLQTLLRLLPVAVGIAEDPECRNIWINAAFADILGVDASVNASKTAEEPVDLPFRVLDMDGNEVPGEELPMQKAARTGTDVGNFELQIVRRDGRVLYEYGQAAPLFDEDGTTRGSIGVFIDITERKHAEIALRESEERFRNVADSAPVLIWMSDISSAVTWVNKSWLTFTGSTLEAEIGDGWLRHVHPADSDYCITTYRECFEQRAPFSMEYRMLRADKHWRWVLDNGSPRFSPDGHFLGFIGSCVDITDRKQAEEALRRANTDLEQFAYSASHDLKEPLRNISIFGELLNRRFSDQLDDRGREFLAHVVNGAKRMEILIQDLLAYTRSGEVTDDPIGAVDSSEVLRSALASLEESIRESQAIITYDALPVVTMRPIHLQQIFQNLVQNSIKYRGAEPPRINITARRTRASWEFTISDNGIGIEPQYRERIFGIFKRLHASGAYPGTGIGLAICQRIVDRYGGRIWVEPSPPPGATFKFTIPLESSREFLEQRN